MYISSYKLFIIIALSRTRGDKFNYILIIKNFKPV